MTVPSITTVGPVTYIADYAALHSVILALTQENQRLARRGRRGDSNVVPIPAPEPQKPNQ
jgi:hypothetical protein